MYLTYVTVKFAFKSFSVVVCGSGGDIKQQQLLLLTGNHLIYYVFFGYGFHCM